MSQQSSCPDPKSKDLCPVSPFATPSQLKPLWLPAQGNQRYYAELIRCCLSLRVSSARDCRPAPPRAPAPISTPTRAIPRESWPTLSDFSPAKVGAQSAYRSLTASPGRRPRTGRVPPGSGAAALACGGRWLKVALDRFCLAVPSIVSVIPVGEGPDAAGCFGRASRRMHHDV
jgi:hypothetical protein